jgi:hypothetical protein
MTSFVYDKRGSTTIVYSVRFLNVMQSHGKKK